MAQQAPDEPPESIVLQSWAGVKNLVSPERLGLGDLEAAVNIDLDDAGQPRRRRGYERKADGAYHSAKTHLRGTLIAKDGSLGWLYPNYSFASLTNVGLDRVASLQVVEDIYFTSASASGLIRPDDSVSPWGVSADGGTWLSPVVTPTDTLGAISGKLLKAPPLATLLELYNGRIYLAAGHVLWATELFQYAYVDSTRTFFQFESDITLLRAVDDGLYVGTDQGLFFMKGEGLASFRRAQVGSARVIPGSEVAVPTERVHPQARQGPVPDSTASVFLTSEGWCAAFDGGQVLNLTRDRMVFPAATSAAALYREQDGATHVLAVADSGGTPVSTARIGDYLDVEIIRAADRGL